MSLDIYLYGSENEHKCVCPHCQNEHINTERVELHSQNITHNLNKMAEEAGFYGALWRPEENGIVTATDLLPHLEAGLSKLKSSPQYFKQFDAQNGWGLYVHFVPWLEKLIEACKAHPDAKVEAWR